MTRAIYWSLILIPAVLLGIISGLGSDDPAEFTAKGLGYLLPIIPILGFWRMKYLKFTWKEMLLFCVPFLGLSVRRRFYSGK